MPAKSLAKLGVPVGIVMIVVMLVVPLPAAVLDLLIAANIAAKFGEYSQAGRGALIASGLVLFVITFAVNAVARVIVVRAADKRLA